MLPLLLFVRNHFLMQRSGLNLDRDPSLGQLADTIGVVKAQAKSSFNFFNESVKGPVLLPETPSGLALGSFREQTEAAAVSIFGAAIKGGNRWSCTKLRCSRLVFCLPHSGRGFARRALRLSRTRPSYRAASDKQQFCKEPGRLLASPDCVRNH